MFAQVYQYLGYGVNTPILSSQVLDIFFTSPQKRERNSKLFAEKTGIEVRHLTIHGAFLGGCAVLQHGAVLE
jgi:hypothetical protein